MNATQTNTRAAERPIELGVDSFAAAFNDESRAEEPSARLNNLLDQIARADEVGLDSFGVGEHHRKEFYDSAPTVILGAAAARTKRIRLTSAVTVLGSVDPVRLFEQFATIDLLSKGRAEIIAGKGSFGESYPLFGYNLEQYQELFSEHLELLLKLRASERVTWSGKHRPALDGQAVYPRPIQNPLPIWIGVGGNPRSAARAGALGLPLMLAIIGGESRRFRPLVDIYYAAGRQAGFPRDQLKVGMHSPGYVATDGQTARDDFFPGLLGAFNEIGPERGWGPISRADLEAQAGPAGAYLVGDPDEVAVKILRHSRDLGGLSRVTFQMNAASLPHPKLMKSIELVARKVAPVVREAVAAR